MKIKKHIILFSLVVSLGGLLFGYDTAVISGTVSSLNKFFIEPLGLTETVANSKLGFVVSSALIGCIIGGLIGGLVSLKLGRKKGLLLAAFLFFISALGSSMPEIFIAPIGEGDHTCINLFIFYRIIGGIGVGLASLLSPMYIAEIAPANIRGKLVSWYQFAIITGMLIVYFINYFIAQQGNATWLDAVGWRLMFASETIPALIFMVLMFFVPETPRYLAIKKKDDEALKILTKINGLKTAKTILTEIKSTVQYKSGKLFSYGKIILIIGILLSLFQQFVGINVVLYYAPEIFKNMGKGTNAALLQTIIIGFILVIFTIIAIFTVDRLGRKYLQIIGAVGMAFFMISLGFSFYIEKVGMVSLICMLGFVACFALSWGPVTWVLLSEIFPNKIRGKAMAISVAVQWVSNYLVSWTFPMMDKSSFLTAKFNHGFAFIVYGVIALMAAYFVWKFVPETKGKSLEEIEKLWKK